jgi:hypothetical protein
LKPLPNFDRLSRWGAQLMRAKRQPQKIRLTRGVGDNQDQECARRRRFYERHRTAVGGGPIWENDPMNPRRGYNVGTVIING